MTIIFTLFTHLFVYSTQQFIPSFRKKPLKIFYNTSLELNEKVNFVCMVDLSEYSQYIHSVQQNILQINWTYVITSIILKFQIPEYNVCYLNP